MIEPFRTKADVDIGYTDVEFRITKKREEEETKRQALKEREITKRERMKHRAKWWDDFGGGFLFGTSVVIVAIVVTVGINFHSYYDRINPGPPRPCVDKRVDTFGNCEHPDHRYSKDMCICKDHVEVK